MVRRRAGGFLLGTVDRVVVVQRAAGTRRSIGDLPAPVLFVAGALSQYLGAALAVVLFDRVAAGGVAWLRVVAAAAVLLAWRRPWRRGWDRHQLVLAGAFGTALAGMNLAFYLAIDRLPLGTTVAIEFLGPVAVAAVGARTRRDALALGLVLAGVALLADVSWSGSPSGVLLALTAAGGWAVYVLLGHRVAGAGLGVDGLAAGMVVGVVAIAPLSAGGAAPALASPPLLVACLGVGVLSSVVPYALHQVVLTRLAPARFALLLAVQPATATAVGLVALGQVPAPAEAFGIALVALGVATRPR